MASMRDIAKECNVSAATVSYVLNNRTDEKISKETACKIIKTAKRLHYNPVLHSKPAKTGKDNCVSIIINLKKHNTYGKKLLYYDLAAELSSRARFFGYQPIITSTNDLKKDYENIAKQNSKGIFMIDADSNSFKKEFQGSRNSPVIFLNCSFDDPLFCKIYINYDKIINEAQKILSGKMQFLVMEDICNSEIKEQLCRRFYQKDIFINTPFSDLNSFLLAHRKNRGIIFGDILGLQAERILDSCNFVAVSNFDKNNLLSPATKTVIVRNKTMAAVAFDTLQSMLSLTFEADNNNCILLESEA